MADWATQGPLHTDGRLARWLRRRPPVTPSIRLEQRRIYIVPSRTGVAYLAVLTLMLLAAINYQNSLAYALTFLLGALFLVAILHTWRNLAGLVLHAGHTPPVFAGEHAQFGLRLESTGRAHQAVAVGWPERGSELYYRDVPAQGSSDVELRLFAARRGWLRPGRLRVETRFPLGILVAWSWVDLGLAALVYPRPQRAGPLLSPEACGEADDSGSARRVGDVDDYQGLRGWQPGESTRRLDWKAFSRGRGLFVKEFVGLSGADRLLDFDAIEGDVETRLSLLCGWVLELSEQAQPFALQLPGEHLGPDSGTEHRERCLRALALHGAMEGGRHEGA